LSASISERRLGADLAYVGSPFLAADEANTQSEFKRMIATPPLLRLPAYATPRLVPVQ
jgi:NAD(P)H-dependent flavin oxidoreductase YrpB (nitropropane dioxygenase family)